MTRFALAPMSSGLRLLTWGLFGVPLCMLGAALVARPPIGSVLGGAFVFVALLYASVWFVFRPTYFAVGESDLRIVWPARSRVIPREAIVRARVLSHDEFRRTYGWGVRIGAGGLWGGFGLLQTSQVTFSMWISRLDPLVIVELREGRPLLLTPENPGSFVEALGSAPRAER
ncbi:hypothetical protein AKJ09_02881 [Labilithrix luteola]|uniref:Bacterial Pleckstrin homology domain-containing protein n=1 Tax=Labilithrix luteola TaxID=1391654 RepID=A0A0K1PRS7_9BACT|nr:hypothetical protein [Labilithrix luteola]AKU96217.1 hypothetical protein AKJ09_02881 [Labilithrix luteola]